MKRKILIIILILLLVGASVVYIDYFLMKQNNTYPKIALKEKLSEGSYVYKAIFYKVWYCENTDVYTIGNYKDIDAVCMKEYKYDDKGYYTNESNLKISQRDLTLISEYYGHEVIENMNSKEVLENAVNVSYIYGRNKYKELLNDQNKNVVSNGYNLVVLPDFVLNEGKYEWVYNEEIKYCLKKDGNDEYLAEYNGTKCLEFKKIEYDSTWCENYKSSKLGFDEKINKMCEE